MKIISGPCQVESIDHCVMMAHRIAEIALRIGNPIVFKASFDKANRTSHTSPRGVGLATALTAFDAVKWKTGLEILTDVHEAAQCALIAPAVDFLQIPALLSRQTDLIRAAAETGCKVNIKKGQGMAPDDVFYAAEKAVNAGAAVEHVWLTERGTTFGYHDLVVDMRTIDLLKMGHHPVIFDATHSVQTPNGANGKSGGDRKMMPVLARAALAAGADGLFVETHNDPDNALSDGPVSWPVDTLYEFLMPMLEIHALVQSAR